MGALARISKALYYCAMPGECASDAPRRAQLKKGPPSGHVVNAASQIMTVNSHIVLPRICMKYQNILTEILAGGECLGRGLSTDCKLCL